MTLFEQIKSIPKVDLHINLTSSISTDLAFDLSDEANMAEIVSRMQEGNTLEYVNALKLPIKILRSNKNIILAINDLIDKLDRDNVIYGELFLDLSLYNHHIDIERVLNVILDTIKERNSNLQVVLVLSSKLDKDDNLRILDIYKKYYGNGVNGIYFNKDSDTNLDNYAYLFNSLNKECYPYIINLNSKVASKDKEIYLHAKRVIYTLDTRDDNIISELMNNDIMLEFALTRFHENGIINDYKDYFIYDLIKDNIKVTITSMDMTTLNTDVINEWCVLFNNYPFVLHDLIKIINYNLLKINIDDDKRNKLIQEFKDKSNLVL